MESIDVNIVIIENRMRKDLGDIDALAQSIKENGLIQPIVLTMESDSLEIKLVAGHRRFEALKKLGVSYLAEGVHFIWRSDLAQDEYRKTAVELEENIRRKAMTWSEEILGKQKLLEVYQKIYGAPVMGPPSKAVQQGLKPAGFGVRKLAELLNEAPSTTSEDLEMAAIIQKVPMLQNEPSLEAARRKLGLAVRVMTGQNTTPVAKPLIYKIIVECVNEQHQQVVLAQLRAAGLECNPIVA